MRNKKLFFYIVCILFCFCYIGCKFKQTQTAVIEKNDTGEAKEIENHTEINEFQVKETDNFGGEYIFSSIEILEYENIDLEKYTNLDETIYIRMVRISKGEYNVETNCWLLENVRGRTIEYPNKFFYEMNFDERFHNKFYQDAAAGMYSGHQTDFFYTGTGIVLYYHRFNHEDEKGYERENIEYYIFFNKKNVELNQETLIQKVQESGTSFKEGYTGTVNDNAVRIRDRPSLEGNVVGKYNKGRMVTVLGRSKERMFLEGYDSYWLKIIKDDYIDGWVYGAYIDLIDTQYDLLPEIQ
jgi:hypothetical protein